MALDNIKLKIDSNFIGELESPTGKIKIGDQIDGMEPYHLLFGALASCFYSTFLVIAKKKRLKFDYAELEVFGHKETGKEINLLKQVTIKMIVTNPSNELGILKSAELGAKFCSIHETISKVANIDLDIQFKHNNKLN